MPDEHDSVVQIDKDRLDEEWVKQPFRFHRFAKRLANARKKWGEAKAHADVVEAEVAQAIRRDPTKFGISTGKPTDAAVKAMVTLHLKVRAAKQAEIDAEHLVDVLEAVVNALEHRKKALENLVYLHGRDYFSAPRERDGEAAKVRDERTKDRVLNRTRIGKEELGSKGE